MKTKFKIVTFFILFLSACQKEPMDNEGTKNPNINSTLSLEEVKRYLQQIPGDSSTAVASLDINWDNAKSETGVNGNRWRIALDGQPTYQNYKQGYRELVIIRNQNSETLDAKILEVIPDAIYQQKNRQSNPKTFTGRVFEYDLNYRLTGGRLFNDGKPIGRIKQLTKQEELENANKSLGELNPFKGEQGKIMKALAITTCVWAQDSYVDAYGDFTVHSYQICSTTFIDDGGGGGYYDGVGSSGTSGSTGGGAGGGSTGTTSTPPPPSNLPGEQNNKVDPKKMMECFSNITDPNAAFVVRVYVIEPQPGTSFNVGANSFGHVAISLSKTSGNTTITQTVGFYPTGTGLDKLDSKAQILDNGFVEYNISSTYYVNQESFQKVINFIGSPRDQYHFTDYNCAAFVYGAGQAGGILIPDPTTQIGLSGPGGAGYAKTPAGMASALREQKANSSNSDVNEGGGTIPGSKGECGIK